MEIEASKECCATCEDWQGPREWLQEQQLCRVSASAKGRCDKHQKLKPAQGGCRDWTKKGAQPLP